MAAAGRVRVAVPWLQAALAAASAGGAPPTMSSLAWLGGRGQMVTGEPRPWREWLLEPVGGADLLARLPAGPAVAQDSSLAATGGHWCLAQPVHFAAGLDHLRLAPLAQATPTADEASALGATVSSHFGADELIVAAFVQGAWLLRTGTPIDCATQPPDAVVGHDVHGFMPAGRDGARVRSLMNEIQMLLHDHPVNQRRERTHRLPVNGWWIWGFGAALADATAPAPGQWRLRSDDPWLGAIGRALGRDADAAMATGTNVPCSDTLIAVSQPPAQRVEEALVSVDGGVLSTVMSNVRAGKLRSLDLLAGGTVLHVGAMARHQFWRRPAALSRWLA